MHVTVKEIDMSSSSAVDPAEGPLSTQPQHQPQSYPTVKQGNPGRPQSELTPPPPRSMDGPDYNAVAEVDIAAPADRVWVALTRPELIRQYLHGADVRTDWQIGHPIVWHGEMNGQPYDDKGEVLIYQPNGLLSMTHWSPLAGTADTPENYHVVTYRLAERDGRTHLTLTQTNNDSPEAAEQMARDGWRPILEQLKQVVEAG